MARTDFGPEVKASMQDNANTPAPQRDPGAPKNPGSVVAREGRDSSGVPGTPPRSEPPRPIVGGAPGDLHHVAAAASIAHAILGNRGLR